MDITRFMTNKLNYDLVFGTNNIDKIKIIIKLFLDEQGCKIKILGCPTTRSCCL